MDYALLTKMDLWVLLVLFSVIRSNRAANFEFNEDEEYSLLPPLHSVDEYSACLRRPGGRFCTAYASFVDGDPVLFTVMQKYSENTSSKFNHSRALFGRCVSQNCKIEEETTSDPKRLLEGCLNRTVWDKYKLKVILDDEVFCHEHGEKQPDVGISHIVVAASLLALIMCNIVGSLFDTCCTKKTWKDRFIGQFLLFFSIQRNWKLLTAPQDPKMECLEGLYGIRSISIGLVIVAHSLMPAIIGPGNPKFVEDLYSLPVFHILLNGTVIMQTFLFVSAFLLAYRCQHHGTQVTWRNLPVGVLRRWLRLTPAYAVVLAVTATWQPYISSGPLWDSMVVAESTSCRAVWWQHLLYINNYFDGTPCMRQTWYLATDMQLYMIGLAVLACRSPRARQVALAALFLLGLLLPALITYFQDLDGILLASPLSSSTLFVTDPTFHALYQRGHTNLCSSVLGLAAGLAVHAGQRNNFNVEKYKRWRPLYWLLVPLGFLLPACCQVFYRTPRLPLYWRVLAAALIKPVFGALIGAIIVGTVLKIDTLYRGILSWRGWVPLGRVSFSAYLVHVAYIRISLGSLQQPIHMSVQRGGEIAVFTVLMVNVIAYLFWLAVEAPLSHAVKSCFKTHTGQKAKKKPEKQNTAS